MGGSTNRKSLRIQWKEKLLQVRVFWARPRVVRREGVMRKEYKEACFLIWVLVT